MKKKEIEKKLQSSLRENTPEVWDKIAARTGLDKTPVAEPVFELVPETAGGQRNHTPRASRREPWFVACVFVLAALLASLLLLPWFRGGSKKAMAAGGSFFIDINPSIQITLDKDEKVEDVYPLNEDAKILLADTPTNALRGKTPAEAAEYVCRLAYATGYLAPDKQNNALLLSSALDSEERGKAFIDELKVSLTGVIQSKGLYCAVLTETRSAAVDAEAQKYQITAGKYQLLQKALALGVEIDEDDFDDISISKLNEKIAKQAKKLSKDESKKEQYRQQQQSRKEQAKIKNDAYLKAEDFEELFEKWLEEYEDDFEEFWEDKKEEWKESQRQEYDDDDDFDDKDDPDDDDFDDRGEGNRPEEGGGHGNKS